MRFLSAGKKVKIYILTRQVRTRKYRNFTFLHAFKKTSSLLPNFEWNNDDFAGPKTNGQYYNTFHNDSWANNLDQKVLSSFFRLLTKIPGTYLYLFSYGKPIRLCPKADTIVYIMQNRGCR